MACAIAAFYGGYQQTLNDLDWQPKYDLISGLKESFQNDYLVSGRNKCKLDFAVDDDILKHQ